MLLLSNLPLNYSIARYDSLIDEDSIEEARPKNGIILKLNYPDNLRIYSIAKYNSLINDVSVKEVRPMETCLSYVVKFTQNYSIAKYNPIHQEVSI